MKFSLVLFFTFVFNLLLFKGLDLYSLFSPYISVRLFILITFIPATVMLFRSRLKKKKQLQSELDSDEEAITKNYYKLLGVNVALLVYAYGLSLLVNFSTLDFVSDFVIYLVLFIIFGKQYIRWASRIKFSEDSITTNSSSIHSTSLLSFWRGNRDNILKWAIKIFFIPIMYASLIISTEQLLILKLTFESHVVVAFLFIFGVTFDVMIGTFGYIFSFKWLGNEIKSTDTTVLGWFVCLICYPPLIVIYRYFTSQTDEFIWSDWLAPDSVLYWVWFVLIVATWCIYWISNACFGPKFSNLTWRGLIDIGPYRFTKHPSYIAKNTYWWLHTVPLYGVVSALDAIQNVLALCLVSTIYYLRAKTEERHLMQYSEYRDYAQKIKDEGLFSRLGRIFLFRLYERKA